MIKAAVTEVGTRQGSPFCCLEECTENSWKEGKLRLLINDFCAKWQNFIHDAQTLEEGNCPVWLFPSSSVREAKL